MFASPLLNEFVERKVPGLSISGQRDDDAYAIRQRVFHLRSHAAADITGVDRSPDGETIYKLKYVALAGGMREVRYFAGEMGDTWSAIPLATSTARRQNGR